MYFSKFGEMGFGESGLYHFGYEQMHING